ncbi:MAG: glycosyltransferase family 4 protein [Thermoflavifilum sp.]|uniref:glycosyltransferase family 4 protein n=1 Tax=Thermoflavifilum sp. TaxID=1968839 RepID=UPI0018A5A75D|nr:glycosyltransferase family 4 protein [Thermoflavifilum sp.]QOR75598.1 MAG: glycosyltransferase family 4 protein [Thermoflavifilum sp.]
MEKTSNHNPVRLAIVCNQVFSLIHFRKHLIREFTGRGYEVCVFTPCITAEESKQIIALGARPVAYILSRSGINPFFELFSLISLYLKLRQFRPHVLLTIMLKPSLYGGVVARLLRIPRYYCLITGLGFSFTQTDKKRFVRYIARNAIQYLAQFSIKTASAVMFQNTDDMQLFIKNRLVSSDQAFCVGATGVDLSEWHPVPSVLDPITFLLAARLIQEKGIFEFIEAARSIKQRYPATRFILLGGIDINPAKLSRQQVMLWVNEGIVEWPGHADMRSWLKKASVFVLPSYREGVPRSTQEAMAMGRPVITTDVPGCRETVIDGVNGFLIPPRNAWALAHAMEKFILNPVLIEIMGKESRRMAEERFNVHHANMRILHVMQISMQQPSEVHNMLTSN